MSTFELGMYAVIFTAIAGLTVVVLLWNWPRKKP